MGTRTTVVKLLQTHRFLNDLRGKCSNRQGTEAGPRIDARLERTFIIQLPQLTNTLRNSPRHSAVLVAASSSFLFLDLASVHTKSQGTRFPEGINVQPMLLVTQLVATSSYCTHNTPVNRSITPTLILAYEVSDVRGTYKTERVSKLNRNG